MKKIFAFLMLIGVIMIAGCNHKNGSVMGTHFNPKDIKVNWKLITNPTADTQFARASFTFKNNGNTALDGENWSLFFNQFNTGFRKGTESAPVSLENLGGDFCRLAPKPEFLLEPGKSVTITYETGGSIIKYSGAPQGVYFVFYNNSQ